MGRPPGGPGRGGGRPGTGAVLGVAAPAYFRLEGLGGRSPSWRQLSLSPQAPCSQRRCDGRCTSALPAAAGFGLGPAVAGPAGARVSFAFPLAPYAVSTPRPEPSPLRARAPGPRKEPRALPWWPFCVPSAEGGREAFLWAPRELHRQPGSHLSRGC